MNKRKTIKQRSYETQLLRYPTRDCKHLMPTNVDQLLLEWKREKAVNS